MGIDATTSPGGFSEFGPQGQRFTYEQVALELTYHPDLALMHMQNPNVQVNDPELFVAAWAGMQRAELCNRVNPAVYNPAHKLAESVLAGSSTWIAMLKRVRSGQAPAHELQLVLWQADPTEQGKSLRTISPTKVQKFIDATHTGKLPFVELVDGKNAGPAWWAIQGYVHRKHGQYFRGGAGHLLAITQVDLMEDMGLLQNLNPRKPDMLLLNMLNQLQHYRHLVALSGEREELPRHVDWMAQVLERYRHDTIAAVSGYAAVTEMRGRTWRFLSDPDASKSYDRYLELREEKGRLADKDFVDCCLTSPSQLGEWLRYHLQHALRPGLPEDQQVEFSEKVGAAWAAVTMRYRDDSRMRPIIDRYSKLVQKLLEPYVVDGLPLVAARRESLWLSVLTLEGWYDIDQKVSVFTPDYESEMADRRAAGTAMSENIKRRYGQKAENTRDAQLSGVSHGYQPLAKQIGITVAYNQLLDAAKVNKRLYDLFLQQFNRTVNDIPRRPTYVFRQVFIGLPLDVQQVIHEPALLPLYADVVDEVIRLDERGQTVETLTFRPARGKGSAYLPARQIGT